MPRRLTTFISNHYYHIYNRGVNRRKIFFSDGNYKYLKGLLRRNVPKYEVNIVAYCLMPNHYHLLVMPRKDHNISKFVQSVFGSYTQSINKQRKRHGHLFQGRFRSVLINKESILLHLARYIHLNPVDAGLVSKPSDWEYSNYHEILRNRNTILRDPTLVPNCFPSPLKYKSFVEEYLYIQSGSRKEFTYYAMDDEE